MLGDNIITRGLSRKMHTYLIRGFHVLRVYASKGFYPVYKLLGRGRLELVYDIVGMKEFSYDDVLNLQGIKRYCYDDCLNLVGMKAVVFVDASVIELNGGRLINMYESLNISGSKLMHLSESVDIKGKRDLSPILAALDII